MESSLAKSWPLGQEPRIDLAIPERMQALTIGRDRYGPPDEAITLEGVGTPRLRGEDAARVREELARRATLLDSLIRLRTFGIPQVRAALAADRSETMPIQLRGDPVQ